MHYKTHTTPRIRAAALLWAVLAVLAMCSGAARAQESRTFRIEGYDIFKPGDPVTINVNAYNVDTVDMRVYRIKDPITFFKRQKDINYPNPYKALEETRRKSLVDEFNSTAKTRYRGLLHKVTKSEARETAVESFDINLDGKKPDKPKNIPLLNEKDGFEMVARFDYKVQNPGMDSWKYERAELPVKEPGAYLVEAVSEGRAAYAVVPVTNMRFIDKSGPTDKLVFVCDGISGRPIAGAEVLFMERTGKGYTNFHSVKTGRDGIAAYDYKRDDSITYLVRKGDDFLAADFYYYNWMDDQYKVYAYTDRPVYRPGHTVHFKAVLRKDQDRVMTPLANKQVTVTILDSSYDKVEDMTLKTNDMGTLAGSFTLKSFASLGRYQIQIVIDDFYYYGQFKVEEYRKPEYKVKITPDEKSYIAGDTVTATIQADYFFGEPVAQADVEYFIYQSRYYIPWWQDYGEDYQYGWYYATNEEYEIWDSTLIDKGEALLDENGRVQIQIPPRQIGYDAVFRIVAKVTDKNRMAVEGQSMVKMSRGLFTLRSITDRYSYDKGDTVKASVQAMTIEGKPVNAPVRVHVERREWVKDKKGNWEQKTHKVSEKTLRTSKDGKAAMDFKAADTGNYVISLMAEDERGNVIEDENSVYVYSRSGGWYIPGDTGSIEIIADKKGYQAGDTASLIFISALENATMLITVEGDRVYEHKVVTLDGANAYYEVKLKDEYAPNVFVTATLVSGGEFYMNEKELVFPPLDKFLNIELSTDKKQYLPGEEAKVTVKVTDRDGKPVDAEVSVGIVDEAIYSISEEVVPDIKKFFYSKRWNRVQTDYSWGFYSYGYSKELHMLLARNKGRTLAHADFKSNKDKVRKNFKDTMHWAPSVRTGKDGKAEITAKCPDNLTSWRITARAVDSHTRVGQDTRYFIARKQLILSLGLPRFFRENDTVVLSTTVHNYLDGEREIEVTLKADGLDVTPAGPRKITIKRGGSERLDWTATVPAGSGEVTVFASAVTGKDRDAVELKIPRLPYGMQVSAADFLELAGKDTSGDIKIAFPDSSKLANASLRVEVSPTLAGGAFSALDYLISYPYGCVEQTMSSFLPNIIVAQTIKGTAQEKNKRFKELPDMVAQGMDRLYNYQHGDGGWGWWEFDDTHPFMTAYVVYGLALAKEAGFPVRETVFQNGVASLRKQLTDNKFYDKEIDFTTRLYMAYALSVAGDTDPEPAASMYHGLITGKTQLNNYGRAMLALTLHRLGREESAKQVAKDIIKHAITENGRTRWEGKQWHYNWQDDVYETTAQCVRALAAISPDAPEITQAVRWLVRNRKGGTHWRSTRDTAIVVFALLDFAKARGEFKPDVSATISVNGGKALKHSFGKNDAFADPWTFEIAGANLKRANALSVIRKGKSPLYVTVTRTYYKSDAPIPASDAGFTVHRSYNLLQPQKAGGEWVYLKKPVTGPLHPGDELLVTVKVVGTRNSEYVMVEDFLPAGFEVVQDTRGYSIVGDDFRGFKYGESYWGRHVEFRDDRVGFFRTYWWDNVEVLQYIMRAELPGKVSAMPATAELMYYPEVRGNSTDAVLEIQLEQEK
jgi:hypothetical protein